ncbi:hypothetical protein [Staphylococcus chromogenes]|uniref:hypothetical protein n=1 Tax=Staphylococcus chromogenes TaxID=46126 RepID=UPI000D19B927|nr:hypothetical protein [Staphylococcus chromogenes]PTG23377.1 hypothetical protein BU642_03985 [Staphylococcus chromogenes]PTG95746.1 hypothetical protein BU632_07300 [Staphylococcus chromogenes]
MEQQVSNREKALFMQVNDLNASCIELRTMVIEYQDENMRLKKELEQYKQDNAKLEQQNK